MDFIDFLTPKKIFDYTERGVVLHELNKNNNLKILLITGDNLKNLEEELKKKKFLATCNNLVSVGNCWFRQKKESHLKRIETLAIKLREKIKNKEVSGDFHTQELIFSLGIQNETEGDLLRKALCLLVCEGYLSVKRFNAGSKGHLWNVRYNIHNLELAQCECFRTGSCKFKPYYSNDVATVESYYD